MSSVIATTIERDCSSENVSHQDGGVFAQTNSSSPAEKGSLTLRDAQHAPNDVSKALELYFKHIHCQPICCLDHSSAEDSADVNDELAVSLLAVTRRFTAPDDWSGPYDSLARKLVMSCIANGTVSLATLSSLCLLSYSYFLGTVGDCPMHQSKLIVMKMANLT